jgi:protein-glutamine gamma-glutamyltransferase
MYLERLLQINIATLASLGTVLLSMGQRAVLMPVLVLISAFASFWVTDVTRWFRLPRIVANVASLAAVFLSLQQTLQMAGELRILAIANLLYYLEIILFFQEKDERAYRQLMVLSFMQVAVAAMFNQGLWFGLLLVAHLSVSTLTLSLLFMHGQWRRHRRAASASQPSNRTIAGAWPLGNMKTDFSSAPAGNNRAGISGELFGRMGKIVLGSLILTLLVFATVPRFGRGAWRGAMAGLQSVVGFEDSVQLGQLHGAIENPEPVMRISLRDNATGKSIQARGGLYLRGSVLTQYGLTDRGQWTCSMKSDGATQIPEPTGETAGVVQSIELNPLDRQELFCVWPFSVTQRNENVRLDSFRQRLLRSRDSCGSQMNIELGTSVIVDGYQVDLVPWREPGMNMPLAVWQKTIAGRELLRMPDLPRLSSLAKKWIDESGLPESDQLGRARAIESKMRDSGEFQYSLKGQARNYEVDPIEDFVSEHPIGHCEYFATALAMMLRAAGIPTRVIVGFHCDEWHGAANYYQVRQLHAHTWVEAYLTAEQLPRKMLEGPDGQQWSEGGWLRLDATPAASGADSGGGSAWGQFQLGFRWLQDLWADYVMEMDRQRQRDAIYGPLVESLKNLYSTLKNPQWWHGVFDSIISCFSGIPYIGQIGGWLVAILVCLMGLIGVSYILWQLWRLARRLWRVLTGSEQSREDARPVEVEFYRRFEHLLARQGLVRSKGQTQREFARFSGRRLAAASPGLAGLPETVADAYYQVRFGHEPLDKSQAEEVEQALEELSGCLS